LKNDEAAQALRVAWKIPGLYRKAEAGFLYRLARRRGTLVEIGCWMGRTTSLMVQAANVWHARVVSIDPFGPMPNGHAQASSERWRSNLRRVGLVPPQLMEMGSDQAAAEWSDEISFLFIDGDHSRAAVQSDLEKWTPFVKVGGVVALHDMFYPSITGVCLTVAEWWSAARNGSGKPRWQFVGLHDFTIAFKRLE
jgi:predicted O-methyltransferase YrrM